MNAFFTSVILGHIVEDYEFSDDDYYELSLVLESPELVNGFHHLEYIIKNLGYTDLSNGRLWNNTNFLYELQILSNKVQHYLDKINSEDEAAETVDDYGVTSDSFISELQSLNPLIKIKRG